MVLSDAERKRLSRARQKAAQRAAIQTPPANPKYLQSSFADFMRDRDLDLFENLDAFGVVINGSRFDEEEQRFPSQVVREEPLSALERAIGIVDSFTDAAAELALQINQYKLFEIERAIEESLERSTHLPPGDVEAMKAAWAETDRLKQIRTDLRKPTRNTACAIRARGE